MTIQWLHLLCSFLTCYFSMIIQIQANSTNCQNSFTFQMTWTVRCVIYLHGFTFMTVSFYTPTYVAQFSDIPVTVISNFQLKFLSKSTVLFQRLQTKIMIFGNTNVSLASNNITFLSSSKTWNLPIHRSCFMCR